METILSPIQYSLLNDQAMIPLTKLDHLVPPMLEKALGYDPEHLVAIPIPDRLRVAQRFVAFYWDGKFTYTDGMLTATGQWYSWQIYLYHLRIAPFLQRFEFGADDGPPEHYFLLDREQRKIFVAPTSLAKTFLRAQRWAFLRTLDPTLSEYEENAPRSVPMVSQEELAQLTQQWASRQGSQTPIQFALDSQREIEASLQSWLDHPPIVGAVAEWS